MEKAQATDYLTNLISKTLRITTTDTRLFVGEFKCTDSDRNIILSRAHEYRRPSPSAITNTITTTSPSSSDTNDAENENKKTVRMDMTSRYLGLIVVPGQYVTKIELEDFASQMRRR